MFIAGDDAQATARVSVFVESLGMHPMDAGPLTMARALENTTLLQLGLIAHGAVQTSLYLGVRGLGHGLS
ncbi:MAG: oxidoreductase [Mycobacterium sp.]